ncbi:MAG: pantoate--beta-alanine ligase [Enterobacterales bacterium]|nr:pantoate--beta-alanine ligase [Enterobacterales bacterium]
MQIFQDPYQIQQELRALKCAGKRIGLIPTMGNLHRGHLSLFKLARKHCDVLVGSIFVNPMQFGANEDLDKYPRTLTNDVKKLQSIKVDYLFTPTNEIIYPLGTKINTSVEVNRLTKRLCGESRPQHFKGVATVVNILFNILMPDVVVFGKKDYQQYLILSAMVKDLFLPIEIIAGEIIREDNGLAMSSRNKFLTEQEKDKAAALRQIISDCGNEICSGNKNFMQLKKQAIASLKEQSFKVDYFDICNAINLEDATANDKQILIACAAWMGQPRLLDNLEITLN